MHKLSFRKERVKMNWDGVKSAGVWTFQILLVCLFAFVFVWYFGQRVSMVGDSMKPLLKNGDIVLINRIVYDASTPKRGDIVAFRPNGNENSHFYFKRLIGLPGETVQIKEHQIYINGKKIQEKQKTTKIEDAGLAKDKIQLKGDEYFVLGDNRKSSEDSRMADVGNVKRSEIEGKAWVIVFPHKHFGFIKKEK